MPSTHCTQGSSRRPLHGAPRGFSLIELMIAISILAIITAVALPSFMDAIRKGRRSEAVGAIANVQQAQERFRGRSATYSNDLSSAPSASSPGLGIPATTANGRYTLALAVGTNAATEYTITATGAGAQYEDVNCRLMAARQQGGTVSYGSGTSAVDWSDPKNCWAK